MTMPPLLQRFLAPLCVVFASAFPAQAADKVTFLIDWLPAGDKAAVYYGIQKSIFADAGLDVAISVGRGSSDVVTRLATGSADFGTGGMAALLQASATNDVPVKALMPIYSVQPDAILTRSDSGIASLADLAGRRVATATFSSSNVVWPLLLARNGIDPDGIDLVKVEPGALAPMLASGQVDATISWLTVAPVFETALAGSNGGALLPLPWSQYGFEGYGMTLFASSRTLDERPQVARRFVAAYKQATEAAIRDPAGTAEALKAIVPETDESIALRQWEASIPLMVNGASEKTGFGVFDPALLATTWTWVARSQNLDEAALDPQSVIAISSPQ